MSFAVRILTINEVVDHPNADRLSVCRVLDYNCITAKDDDGNHRFTTGERVIYVPEGAVLTEEQLREQGFWQYNAQLDREMGTLSGREGNRVKPIELRKIMSTGLLWKLPDDMAHLPDNSDVAEQLGIIKYIPEVPAQLLKVAMPLFDAKVGYDIERLKTYPNLLVNDEIVITEKLEGECLIMTWMGGQQIDGLFANGRIAITTKGLSEKGLVFIDNDEARKVPVVRAAFKSGLLAKLEKMAMAIGANNKVRLFCEAVGPGVKKLHYDGTDPFARAFDVRIDDRYLGEDEKAEAMAAAAIERVPVLYRGPFDAEIIESYREGPTTIGGKHIREGVVVTAVGDQTKRTTELGDELRPILKVHSDVFLRKFNLKDDDA